MNQKLVVHVIWAVIATALKHVAAVVAMAVVVAVIVAKVVNVMLQVEPRDRYTRESVVGSKCCL